MRLELLELVDRFRGCNVAAIVTPNPTPRMEEMFDAFGKPAVAVVAPPNPGLGYVGTAFDHVKASKARVILAIGGGSVMDTGKLIASWSGLPLGVVPTTAGTGAEATEFATVYKDGRKQSVPCGLPTFRVVDAEVTMGMSPYLAACTGMDALCHGLEAKWAKSGTARSNVFATQAVEQALLHLIPSVVDPTEKTRFAMLIAAFRAGQAINVARTTAAHALSYELTTQHGIPHGHAVALMMLRVLRLRESRDVKADVSAAEFEALMNAVGLDKELPPQTPDREWLVNDERLNNDPLITADDIATLTES